ncbi:bifunctional phosphoribosylaminoimidazolecarboxamide formyltransferase/IMP cyclohydrolase [soil metagenome]
MRALLSVYDKSGLVELAEGLCELGWELVSSGKTARALAAAGVTVTEVADITGFPEMPGGLVKTLHPKVRAAILADTADAEHRSYLDAQDITPIDLVVSNLYPFAAEPSIATIDIGGPAMVRAAAKNHARVGVVVRPGDYPDVLDELRHDGSLSSATRHRLARAAFAHTAAYDAAIVGWFDGRGDEATSEPDLLPASLHLALDRAQGLRYGENPHQAGARYRFTAGSLGDAPGWWDGAVQHGGKALSYLNLYDAEAAWRLVHQLGGGPAAVVVKHANPCGAAGADDITDAYRCAHEGDPVSAFGGIVALNRPVPLALAEALGPVFTEVIIAPAYEADALARLVQKKKQLRVLEAPPPGRDRLDVRSIDGGFLVQTVDAVGVDRSSWQVVSKAEPTDGQWRDLELAWQLVASVKSNSIVLVKDGQAVGIGAGQQNRKDAGTIAAEKAGDRAVGAAVASDAFFPFRDGLDNAVASGATAVIQPGGSIRDDEVIAAADEHGVAMVLTGERHFRH